MSDIAIRVENLSKQYRIGSLQPRYKTLRGWLAEAAQTPVRRLSNVVRGKSALSADETIWALKDVSFEVKRGEVVGVIGRNGAGKTTLLKILSRITEPTGGRARIRGRVGSLLEVGTGFHPELTGRENTYLNGAILGMKRAEIERRFDEIVAFAEIEKFIDTPVKHYSSGMRVRLAFAVAAHLEPEILLVDEVLAVGDVEFQRKCLGKMGDVAREGKTILFVSHNMAAIRRLCHRAILINDGELSNDDRVDTIVGQYLSEGITPNQPVIEWSPTSGPRTNELALRMIRIVDKTGRYASTLNTGDDIVIEVEYDLLDTVRGLRLHIGLLTQEGVDVFSSSDSLAGPHIRQPGSYVSRCVIPKHLLNVGTYIVRVGADVPGFRVILNSREYLSFSISELSHNPMGLSSGGPRGIINPMLSWTVESTT